MLSLASDTLHKLILHTYWTSATLHSQIKGVCDRLRENRHTGGRAQYTFIDYGNNIVNVVFHKLYMARLVTVVLAGFVIDGHIWTT